MEKKFRKIIISSINVIIFLYLSTYIISCINHNSDNIFISKQDTISNFLLNIENTGIEKLYNISAKWRYNDVLLVRFDDNKNNLIHIPLLIRKKNNFLFLRHNNEWISFNSIDTLKLGVSKKKLLLTYNVMEKFNLEEINYLNEIGAILISNNNTSFYYVYDAERFSRSKYIDKSKEINKNWRYTPSSSIK